MGTRISAVFANVLKALGGDGEKAATSERDGQTVRNVVERLSQGVSLSRERRNGPAE